MRVRRQRLGAGLACGLITGGLAFGAPSPVSAELTSVDLEFGVNGTATVPVLASGEGYGSGSIAATRFGSFYVTRDWQPTGDDYFTSTSVTRFDSDGQVDADGFGDEGSVVFNFSERTNVVDTKAMSDGGLLVLVSVYGPNGNDSALVRLRPDGTFDDDYSTYNESFETTGVTTVLRKRR
jgi:hypothetical protein